MAKTPRLPVIPEHQRSPLVSQLLEVIQYQSELIQAMRNDIAILKKNKPKPKIKPSGLDKEAGKKSDGEGSGKKRSGSAKRNKTEDIEIHETKVIAAVNVPPGSRFKGYKEFVVQGIVISPHNVVFKLERWQTPDGSYVDGELPETVRGHFSSQLISFILYQYHQCHVTQPLLLEQLHEYGIDISSGQVNRILVEGHDGFHYEKDELLSTALSVSSYIQVDDTGARHQGKNGICTHIGNSLFAWFESTQSKSRINFLELLRASYKDYFIDDDALAYMEAQKLPKTQLELLAQADQKTFENIELWEAHLVTLGISMDRHRRIATEGALVGSILSHGFNPELVILSDDAGQFDVFLHALCWVHAERTIHKIVPFNEAQRAALASIRSKIWDFYKSLKVYKSHPVNEKKKELEARFDEIFQEETCFITLNLALKRLKANKTELLLVLNRPDIPLHNNSSESDIREYAKRRKVSGGTRSHSGRKSRDTFTSLKKTCRKLEVSFWNFLNDRVSKTGAIPQLSDLIRQKALAPP